MSDQQQLSSDARIKSDEAAARRVANSGGVGAFAVAQAAPGGRRQGPRVRRSASARRRARQRAGLEPADGDPNSASGTSGGGASGGGGGDAQLDPEVMAAVMEAEQLRAALVPLFGRQRLARVAVPA